ncbi:type II secretion system protein GspK [Marinicellulosiphila megalodicopiae]|uniref:type II secretion system protein GspK n=1 Tax=Marinicellulosiphila megalodicopiae TaxID=2724896 RepID=UPI003BAFEA5A
MIRNQKGVALFQVLVMITILIGIFGLILAKQVRLQGKLSTSITLMKFEQIELSAERLVLDFLQQDRLSISQNTTGHDWPYLMDKPLENILGASIDFSIYPLDGLLNLNLLYNEKTINQYPFSAKEILAKSAIFETENSFNALQDDWSGDNFSDPQTGEIKSAVELEDFLLEASNFIQSSSNVGVNFDYDEPKYLKSGLPFADLSEILLVSDRTIEQRLSLYNIALENFSILPANSKLNINEAPARVLSALHPSLNSGIISEIIKIQDAGGFKSVDDFINMPSMQDFKEELPSSLLTHISEFFVARILITMPTDNEQDTIERMRDIFIYRPIDQSKPVQIYQRKFVPL